MSMTSLPFTVQPGTRSGGAINITVRIDCDAKTKATDILHYLRSIGMKQDLQSGWCQDNYPGYGMAVHGGPRPVFKDPKDRGSGVLAYEQDFRLTKPI